MGATSADASKAQRLYDRLERSAPDAWLDSKEWVHLALTQIVVLLGDDEPVFVQAGAEVGEGGGSLVVFTDVALLVARSDDADGKSVRTVLAARSAIEGFEVGGGEPIVYSPDAYESRYRTPTWPGRLTASVTYRGLPEPVKVSGPSVDRFDKNRAGEILGLLSALKRDLVDASAEKGDAGPQVPIRVR